MWDMKKKVALGIFFTLCLLGVSTLWFGNNAGDYNPEFKSVDVTPALIESVTEETPSPKPIFKTTTTASTIGTREFNVTAEGDFEHFACKAIKEAVYQLPPDTDIIVTAGRDKPFEVFRVDLLVDTLQAQDLPFIVWEDVPVEDRLKAHFSTISNKSGMVRDRRVMEFISLERTIELYPESWIPSKMAPVRKHQLTDVHSLVEIQGYFGLARFDERLFQNWTKGYSPFIGGESTILGPFIILKHSSGNDEIEFPIASNLLDQEYTLLEIFRDDQFLYTVTIYDKMQWTSQASIKVTRFDPAQFTYAKIDDKTIELCEITFKLQ